MADKREQASLLDLAAIAAGDDGAALEAVGLGGSAYALRLARRVLAGAGSWDGAARRRRIRTALAERRERGDTVGRPSRTSPEVASRIVTERDAGKGWTEIARGLTDDGVPTATGGHHWWPASVQSVHRSATRPDRDDQGDRP